MKRFIILFLLVLSLLVLSLTACSSDNDPSSDNTGKPYGTGNNAPQAAAGADRNVTTGTLATLDGSASSDADGNMLTFQWSFTGMPGGSNASLSNATTAAPTFTPDVDGDYLIALVVNDGTVNSTPDTVKITASSGNSAPVANAGPDQNALTGSLVTLNGSASSDADGDPLTFQWSFTGIPGGSNVSLSGATTANPTFTPDVDGEYIISLVVNDGTGDSTPDAVAITASSGNSAPVADAGPDQNALTGSLVTLNGSASSDADGDPLTFQWSFTSIPGGSNVSLSGATTASPTFTPDAAGAYVIALVVNDGTTDSAADTVMITASLAVSFAGNIQPIFTSNCTGCHSPGGIASFLNLQAGSSHGNLVNVPATRSAGVRVVPADSSGSVLYLRISGTSVGGQMPAGGAPPLSSSNQDLVRQWIDQGAANN